MSHNSIINILDALRTGEALTAVESQVLLSDAATGAQRAAAAAAIVETSQHQPLLLSIANTNEDIHACISSRYGNGSLPEITSEHTLSDPVIRCVIEETGTTSNLGEKKLKYFVDDILKGSTSPEIAAFWLMTVCRSGLSKTDTLAYTQALLASGRVYDYRSDPDLKRRKFIRRYPTGALSEKAALILPSLIVSFFQDVPICSPFFVARSLGFTGGTWDKLSSIPGFEFPEPGDETAKTLRLCGTAMTVAQSDVCPGDRYLYELRSSTSTVISKPLIVGSIASKQLAVPVHHQLMDVRFGEGAFLNNDKTAKDVGGEIADLITSGGIDCWCMYTNTEEPGGMTIGNSLEVCEAIAVMGSTTGMNWNLEVLRDQKDKVVTFFASLMRRAFPEREENWVDLANKKFEKGEVLQAFHRLLYAHSVPLQSIERLLENPLDILVGEIKPVEVLAHTDGRIGKIDQRGLGHYVNFVLGAGGNAFASTFKPKNGVLLHKRQDSHVVAGEPIASVFCDEDIHHEDLRDAVAKFIPIETSMP